MTPEQIKLQVIYNSLMYQSTSEKRYKLEALSELKKLLNYYHLRQQRLAKKDFNKALIEFAGWIGGGQCINNLINAL